jgi:hypothetical protein
MNLEREFEYRATSDFGFVHRVCTPVCPPSRFLCFQQLAIMEGVFWWTNCWRRGAQVKTSQIESNRVKLDVLGLSTKSGVQTGGQTGVQTQYIIENVVVKPPICVSPENPSFRSSIHGQLYSFESESRTN